MPIFRNTVRTLIFAGLAAGCDASSRDDAASTSAGTRSAEVSLRLDVPSAGSPAISVLAFRAETRSTGAVDVLGVVDPLVAAAPGGRCELRDVAESARALRALGGTLDLEEFAGVSVGLGNGGFVLRPAPHVYPEFGTDVAGVIGEVGPIAVPVLPRQISVRTVGHDGVARRTLFEISAIPRLVARDGSSLGAAPGALAEFDAAGNLILQVAGPASTFVEIRPFGATREIACPLGVGGQVQVAKDLLAELARGSGQVPVTIDAVLRQSQSVGSDEQETKLSLEIRSSAVLELRQ